MQAQIQLYILDVQENEAKQFIAAYMPFMEEYVRPNMVGMRYLKYKMELDRDGFVLHCETNKQLNQDSRSMILFLTKGFIAGWTARGLTS